MYLFFIYLLVLLLVPLCPLTWASEGKPIRLFGQTIVPGSITDGNESLSFRVTLKDKGRTIRNTLTTARSRLNERAKINDHFSKTGEKLIDNNSRYRKNRLALAHTLGDQPMLLRKHDGTMYPHPKGFSGKEYVKDFQEKRQQYSQKRNNRIRLGGEKILSNPSNKKRTAQELHTLTKDVNAKYPDKRFKST